MSREKHTIIPPNFPIDKSPHIHAQTNQWRTDAQVCDKDDNGDISFTRRIDQIGRHSRRRFQRRSDVGIFWWGWHLFPLSSLPSFFLFCVFVSVCLEKKKAPRFQEGANGDWEKMLLLCGEGKRVHKKRTWEKVMKIRGDLCSRLKERKLIDDPIAGGHTPDEFVDVRRYISVHGASHSDCRSSTTPNFQSTNVDSFSLSSSCQGWWFVETGKERAVEKEIGGAIFS